MGDSCLITINNPRSINVDFTFNSVKYRLNNILSHPYNGALEIDRQTIVETYSALNYGLVGNFYLLGNRIFGYIDLDRFGISSYNFDAVRNNK